MSSALASAPCRLYMQILAVTSCSGITRAIPDDLVDLTEISRRRELKANIREFSAGHPAWRRGGTRLLRFLLA